jgi:PAS domain S-box-containing protein/diguanylate cyclase (GGDEF)-like protein
MEARARQIAIGGDYSSYATRLETVLELSGQFYWEQDAQHRFTIVSGGGAEGTAFNLPEWLGKSLWEGDFLPPDDVGNWERHKTAIRAHEPFRDLLIRCPDIGGLMHEIKASGNPLFDLNRQFVGYRGIAVDITAVNRADQLLRLEHLVARCLAGADTVASAIQAVIKAVCDTQGWHCGRFFSPDSANGSLRLVEAWSVNDATVERFVEKSRDVTFAKGSGLTGRVWESGTPIWVADITNDPRVLSKGLHRDANTRGAFIFPVTAEGKTIGVLGFNSRDVREPDERLLQAVTIIGSQIGQFLQRKQAEEENWRFRIAQDEQAASLINEAQIGLFVTQAGVFRFANAFFGRLIGRSVDELIGANAMEIVAPQDRQRVKEQIRDRLTGHPGAPYDIHCLRRDGSTFDARVCGRRIEFDGAPADVVTMLDISDRSKLERELARKNIVLMTQQETSLDAILLVDEDGRILSHNGNFRAMWSIDEELAHIGDDDSILRTVTAQMKHPAVFIARVRGIYERRDEIGREEILTNDGRVIDRFTAPVKGPDGTYFGRVWYFRDITEKRKAEDTVRRANRALLVITAVNQALIRGESERKLLDTVCTVLLDPGGYRMAWIGFVEHDERKAIRPIARCGDDAGYVDAADCTWADTERGNGPTGAAARTGTVQVCRDIASDPRKLPWRSAAIECGYASSIALPLLLNRAVMGVLTIYSSEPDAFDSAEAELLVDLAADLAFGVEMHRSNLEHGRAVARAERLAHFDALTELPNRVLLLEDIRITMRTATARTESFGLLSIDVPSVEELKTSMGFGASDTLAMTIAARLRELCPDAELTARLEGGEFAVRLEPDAASNAESVVARAQTIRLALQATAMVGAAEVMPRCIIGIAMFPGDATDAAVLLERAQTARLKTNAREGDEISFFGLQKSARAVRELGMEAALRHAASRGEFALVYQPEVDLRTGEIVAVEALLRWNSPQFGAVSPVDFIPIAERSNLIVSIGEWVLREACQQAVAWRTSDLRAPRIAVNLSSGQLIVPGIAACIQGIALEYQCDPSWLGLEITESMLIDNSQEVAQVLRQLKSIGFEISLDDFGTGYSSLSRLQDLPIDIVKIDRSFVPDVTAATGDVSVTRAIITMAHSLQLRVLAEGVENEGQLGLLVTNGCDLIQGFYFSRPVPPAEVEAMVRENRRLPEKFTSRQKNGRTLLLVDDEENILSSLRRLLRRDGYQIICATSATEGLRRLAETPVDVIVSDQRMPGMTGVEFLRRAKELYPDTVRIVLSGFTDLQSIIDAVNEGAIYKFLTKPWDDERIRVHIAEAFRQKEMFDENRRLAQEIESANSSFAKLNDQLQHALASQENHANILGRNVESAREMLECVPGLVIGVDANGVVAYVKSEITGAFPAAASAIGTNACMELPWVCTLLETSGLAARDLTIEGKSYQAYVREMKSADDTTSKLIFLFQRAQESDEERA